MVWWRTTTMATTVSGKRHVPFLWLGLTESTNFIRVLDRRYIFIASMRFSKISTRMNVSGFAESWRKGEQQLWQQHCWSKIHWSIRRSNTAVIYTEHKKTRSASWAYKWNNRQPTKIFTMYLRLQKHIASWSIISNHWWERHDEGDDRLHELGKVKKPE